MAPIYIDSRAPAASTSSTSPGGAASHDDTNTTAPTYASPNSAHPSAFQNALPQRAVAIGPYQRSQAARRRAIKDGPMPVTRTSLPGGAVVAVTNRCRARRADCAPRSWAARSTAGRQVAVSTVGSANSPNSASAGWMLISRATVTPRRRSQPQVENSDMYM